MTLVVRLLVVVNLLKTQFLNIKQEILFLIPALIIGSLTLRAVFLAEIPTPVVIEGFIDAKELIFVSTSKKIKPNIQNTETIAPSIFVEDDFVYFMTSKIGDYIEYKIPSFPSGDYNISLIMASNKDFGAVKASINGIQIADQVNLFQTHYKPIIHNTTKVKLNGENDILRIEVIGSEPNSSIAEYQIDPKYQIGIDGIAITKITSHEANDEKVAQ